MVNTKKQQFLLDFLLDLEDFSIIQYTMQESVDLSDYCVIRNYSKILNDAKATFNRGDLILCSMLLGYLLRGQSEKFEKIQKLNNILNDV